MRFVPSRELVTLYNIPRGTHSGAEFGLQYKADAFYIPSKCVSIKLSVKTPLKEHSGHFWNNIKKKKNKEQTTGLRISVA